MSLFQDPVTKVKTIADKLRKLDAELDKNKISMDEQKRLHTERAALKKELAELEIRTRSPATSQTR